MTRTAVTQGRMKQGLSCKLRDESFVLTDGGPKRHPEEVTLEIGLEAGESRASPEDMG